MTEQTHDLAVQFYDLYRTISKYRRRLAEQDMEENSTFRLLDVLYAQGPCSLKRICSIMSILPSSGSTLVDKCVKSDLVQRETNPSDRRKVTISLTTKGRKTIENELNKQYRLLEEAFVYLSDKDKKKMSQDIESLAGILKEIPLDPEE